MLMMTFALIGGLILGALAGWGFRSLRRHSKIRSVQARAAQLLSQSQKRAQEISEAANKQSAEIETRIRQRHQKELAQKQQRLKTFEEQLNARQSQQDREFNEEDRPLQKEAQALQNKYQELQKQELQYRDNRSQYQTRRQDLINRFVSLAALDPETLKREISTRVEQDLRREAKRKASAYEEAIRADADNIAKRMLGTALNRFPRPYCPERGIGVVELANDDMKKRIRGPEDSHLKAIQTACGVDILIQDDTNTIAVAGFDPVRRELATRVLEKLLKEREVNPAVIERTVEKTKGDLFRKIEEDAKRVTTELGQTDLHPEIKRMLGSLRYRYSFAQNQYFHVAEVGWLCGLLASELGEDIASAKRSGLLHDVGKAMDHSIEGGHAVIGADFIQKYGEKPHVVHAVRAHHYEEQPSTDLAFLVIGADAISGARPGARRSTVSSYNQKMAALETIAEGFPGVTRTLIFNAGREVRVMVDGGKVNDEQSLKLCRDIADKIEAECSYPGQIKVVVVRETNAEAIAK